MEVEDRGLEDDWLVSFRGPCSASMVMGGRVKGVFLATRFGDSETIVEQSGVKKNPKRLPRINGFHWG